MGLRPRRHADRLQRGGTSFVFDPLLGVGDENETIFALQVLPVIIFLGRLIGLLFYLRVNQYLTYVIGGAIS